MENTQGTPLNNQLDEQLESLSAQVEAGFENGRARWADWKANIGDSARNVSRSVDDCVHNHTWSSIAIAAALGACLGIMLGRR
ncbi:MAG: hypothetical protein SFY81_03795 [Verrucomicrobiota bacterium]|nr:hypothetical protein [Verrucomicrobiota bacterium]